MYIRRFLATTILLYLILLGFSSSPSFGDEEKHVLIINSYHYGLSWTDDIDRSVIDTIKESYENTRFFVEYIDWKEYPTEKELQLFNELIQYKYADKHLDLVIATDDAALTYVMSNRDTIFSEVPVVSSGVSMTNYDLIAKADPLITGVIEEVDIHSTIEVALNVNPDLHQLYIIHDQTESGKAMTDATIQTLANWYPDIEPIVITDMSIDQIFEAVKRLKPSDAILMTAYYSDVDGRTIDFEDMIRGVSEATQAPVFSLYDFALNNGALGGSLLSGRETGKRAGELAVEILGGVQPEQLPLVTEGFHINAIDYNVAMAFKIDVNRLSDDITIINKPMSLFVQYRAQIITILVIMSLMVIFIIILTYALRKTVKLKNELTEKHFEQIQLNEELTASEEELKAQFEALNELFDELQMSKEQNELILDAIRDTILDWNIKDEYLNISERWAIPKPAKAIDKKSPAFLFEYVHPEDTQQLRPYFGDEIPEGVNDFSSQIRILSDNNHYKWYLLKGAIKRDREGNATRMICSFTDIHAIKQMEDQIRHVAFHDSLTGLPNKNALEAEVRKDKNGHFGILLADIDHFKRINDTMGHRFGDKYIQTIGKMLALNLGPNSKIYRISGDEFIIYHKTTDTRELESLGKHLLHIMNRVIQVEYSNFSNSISIGIAMYPEDGDNIDDLITRADLAMYKSKESGRGKSSRYDASMFERIKWRVEREEALKLALPNQELSLAYQPQVDSKTKEIIGFEALIRWQHPTLGRISPLDFIPIAEETQLIMPIGRWVIENALSFISDIKELTSKRIHISVNVSVLQLMQEDFEEMILELLSIYRVSPDQFIIEITESVLMQAIDAAVAKLERLQSTGVKVALDDFGTGYSSLSYLKNLPIDILKIDKSFIDALGVSQSHDDLVETIIRLGQQLDMHLVAEGVETEEQLEKLKAINCDAIQGYLFSKPVDDSTAKKLLKNDL
ncbi:MAG: hypothetical protein BGO41_07775 [Clostridiales bacterium 38-18]|nr:MAG: hypothetical protein BGO41_07775 [Clostridiales bacterium 38-18]